MPFGFFRRSPAPAYPAADGPWSIATHRPGSPALILRINVGAAALRGHPDFATQVGIAVPFRDPDPNGFPGPAEDAEVRALEEALRAALMPEQRTVLVAVLTTEGMREFVWYTRDPKRVRKAVTAVANELRTHQVQLIMQEDPDWEVYAAFSESGNGTADGAG